MIDKIKKILEEHVGKKNAISSAKIADIIGVSEDDTHVFTRDLLLQAAETYGLPLAASNRGYYLISNDTEYEEYMTSLDKRIEGINKRKDIITQNYKGDKK
ncbi:hypothetical protein [Ruminococcus flavefaciens]|uniref:hypothetical protein n=1 Tax=Ruminococcus flavefaciens TaxID=1265 RepID=UPI00046656E9|nr:hypothetical protein [Ruminococcus flavefaciens]